MDIVEIFEEFSGKAVEVADDIWILEIVEKDIDNLIHECMRDNDFDRLEYVFGITVKNVTWLDMDVEGVENLVGTYYMINGGDIGMVPNTDPLPVNTQIIKDFKEGK